LCSELVVSVEFENHISICNFSAFARKMAELSIIGVPVKFVGKNSPPIDAFLVN